MNTNDTVPTKDFDAMVWEMLLASFPQSVDRFGEEAVKKEILECKEEGMSLKDIQDTQLYQKLVQKQMHQSIDPKDSSPLEKQLLAHGFNLEVNHFSGSHLDLVAVSKEGVYIATYNQKEIEPEKLSILWNACKPNNSGLSLTMDQIQQQRKVLDELKFVLLNFKKPKGKNHQPNEAIKARIQKAAEAYVTPEAVPENFAELFFDEINDCGEGEPTYAELLEKCPSPSQREAILENVYLNALNTLDTVWMTQEERYERDYEEFMGIEEDSFCR